MLYSSQFVLAGIYRTIGMQCYITVLLAGMYRPTGIQYYIIVCVSKVYLISKGTFWLSMEKGLYFYMLSFHIKMADILK